MNIRLRFGADRSAVSDIIGSLLLVAAVLIAMGVVAVFVLSIEGPEDQVRADLSLSATPGADGWGTGDEAFVVIHDAGEPVPKQNTLIQYTRNGIATILDDGDLNGAWTDGHLTIGESWSYTLTIQEQDRLELAVITRDGTSRIIEGGLIRGGDGIDCSGDALAPTVGSWVQAPSDVSASTTGAVTITVQVTDDCAGTDEGIDPVLEHRFDGGAWTSEGAMTRIGPALWQGTIPDQTWALHAGKDLEYHVTGLTDLNANSGDSTIKSDTIQVLTSYTYVHSFIDTMGTTTGFGGAQSDADLDAAASLAETESSIDLYAQSATQSGGASDPDEATGAPDDVYTTLEDNNDLVITEDFDVSGRTESIDEVYIVIEAKATGIPVNDIIEIAYDLDGTWDVVDSSWVPPLIETEREIDITSEVATWSWTDVQDIRLRAEFDKVGSLDLADYLIDALYIRVVSTGGNTLSVQFDFPQLPAGSSGDLEVRYRTVDENFDVEVWDGTTWNTRGTGLSGASYSVWSYTLTALEKEPSAGLGPIIRFTDDNPGGANNGLLEIEYARVVNT